MTSQPPKERLDLEGEGGQVMGSSSAEIAAVPQEACPANTSQSGKE